MVDLSTTKGKRNKKQIRKTTKVLYYVNYFKDESLETVQEFYYLDITNSLKIRNINTKLI